VRKLLCLLIVVALAGSAVADDTKIGAAGAQFLKIGVGSKYQGMAEASVANVNDAYAMYWNPAGLADVENWTVAFTAVEWLTDINLNYVAMARQFEGVGTFGASVTVLSAGEQEITTVLEQDGTGQYYTASSYAIGVSFARQLTNRFAFGATAKYVGEKIGKVNSRGLAFDFGTMLYTGYNSLRLGMSITNMGPDLKFTGSDLKIEYDYDDDSPIEDQNADRVDADLRTNPYSLPLTFRVGVAYDFELGSKSVVTLSSDFMHPNDHEQKASIGAEYEFAEKFFLRSGYKFNYDEESLAFGGGLIADIGGETQLVIDYAWQEFGRLESTQRFSIGFAF
jgi:type IX secretion system protein PorV